MVSQPTGEQLLRIADLRAEREAAIEQNKRIVAWVCQFIEKRGHVVFTGLSVPKRDLDEARAELATEGDKLQATERTLARAQRIIGSLHIERAGLIERIANLIEAQAGQR
jgi:hypothetical protein